MTIFFPIVELLDRLVIARIKLRKLGGENQAEYDYYMDQAQQYDLDSVQELLDKLEDIHLRIWALESDIRRGLEGTLGLEEVGRRAIEIRNFNNQRVRIKNELAEQLQCPVREIKRDHVSE